ncbi:MAG: hypothetical protein WAW37_02020 [Syntrophobacteraceae bacterium]
MQADKEKRFEDPKESRSLTGTFGQDRMREAFEHPEANRPEILVPETLKLLKENRRRNGGGYETNPF